MLISFELSMPGARSWNGKWSGDGKCFAVVKNVTKRNTPKLGYYSYSFGDGWVAAVTVREITAPAARKLRKQSRGFCGYEWMVDRIMIYGEILNDAQVAERRRPQPSDAALSATAGGGGE